jgi:hypothetical protein
MTGTYSRHKTNNTGLNPLETRMSDKMFERRTARIATRVGRDGALTRGAFVQFVSMGFWARLRWIVRGAR